MTNNQELTDDDVLEWIHERVAADLAELELSSTAREQLGRYDLCVPDILVVLRNAEVARRDYNGGCYTVRGRDVDDNIVAVVVAPPSDKDRIKVVNVWSEQ